jgi:hypothetical protein
MSPFVGIILLIALTFMSSQISYKANRTQIKKKLSFIEGGHQLEKLEFALAIAQTNGDEKKSIILRKKIVELGGNVEEPGT